MQTVSFNLFISKLRKHLKAHGARFTVQSIIAYADRIETIYNTRPDNVPQIVTYDRASGEFSKPSYYCPGQI